MITSGIRPYRYEGFWPFSGSGIRAVGHSGILYEQSMFVLTAEAEIYASGQARTYTKYVNKSAAVSSGFEPKNDGSTLSYRGNVNFKNYITDMRSRFSGLFTLIATDSPYNKEELILDYFQRHTGDNPSGAVGNWLHSANELGASGKLWDIDLREVNYQPYTRIRKFENIIASGYTLPFSPVMPTFCSNTGTVVRTSSRDLAHAANISNTALSGYQVASSGFILIQGDILIPSITKFYVWNSANLASSSTGNCVSPGPRNIYKTLGSGLGAFSVPSTSLGTGLYSIQLFNNNPIIDNYYIPVSGNIGFWPRKTELVSSGYTRATLSNGSNQIFNSGFHIFNTAMWQFSASGAGLLSPINGALLWYRFADNQSWSTTNFGPRRWSDLGGAPATPITGSNTGLVYFVGVTADLNPDVALQDRRFVFAKYNPSTFDFVSAFQEGFSIPAPASPPSISRLLYIYNHSPPSGVNLSDYYCASEVDGASSGPEIYILDTGLENVGAWDNNTNPAAAPLGVINGHIYGFDPTQSAGSGATFLWQHNVYDDPGGVFPAAHGSETIVDTKVYAHETRNTAYDNTNGISTVFEPLNPNNFSFGGIPYIIDPRGTDMDKGDGSVLIRFNAKMKGETVTKSFIGRMNEGTIDSTGYMVISEFIPLPVGTPNWVYGIG